MNNAAQAEQVKKYVLKSPFGLTLSNKLNSKYKEMEKAQLNIQGGDKNSKSEPSMSESILPTTYHLKK